MHPLGLPFIQYAGHGMLPVGMAGCRGPVKLSDAPEATLVEWSWGPARRTVAADEGRVQQILHTTQDILGRISSRRCCHTHLAPSLARSIQVFFVCFLQADTT